MNTYEKVVDYLKLHRKLEYDIEFYRHKMEGLKAISYTEEEKGTSNDDIMTIYMQKIEDAEKKMRDIESFVESNFDGIGRLIISEKYIHNKTFKSIGNEICYSNSHVRKLMNKEIYRFLAR